jgi:Mg2+/Co2+ transporter CorB
MSLALALTVAAIVVLLILSAMFSGSETALTAASRARMHHLAKDGNVHAARVLRLIEDRERLIGAILLGNNLVNILASALATSALIAIFGDPGVLAATVLMTALVLIFSEVMPKTYALHNADRVALVVAPAILLVVRTLAPVTAVIQAIVATTLRIFGVAITGRGRLVTPADEIRGAIDLHTREGRMVKTERDMLDSILDLAEVSVSDIMVHRRNMVMVELGDDPEKVVAEVLASPFTRIPLWQGNPENIVGVLHARDLLRALYPVRAEVGKLDIASLLRQPWFVPETTALDEQLDAFRARKEHFALVVDEYGALMGLVTLEDILEEIVGDIADEHDIEAGEAVRRQADGSIVVDGTVTIRDLNRDLDWALPEDEAATVAGLVIHEARRIPDVGDRVALNGFEFEVLRRQRNQVTALRIRPPASPPA